VLQTAFGFSLKEVLAGVLAFGWLARGLFGQYEFVVAGNAQAVGVAAKYDRNLPVSLEQAAGVDRCG